MKTLGGKNMLCTEKIYKDFLDKITEVREEVLPKYVTILYLLKNCNGATLDIYDINEVKKCSRSVFKTDNGIYEEDLYIEIYNDSNELTLWKLEYDTHWAGYCMCEESDPHYNTEHQCCGGTDCDYDEPYLQNQNTGEVIRIPNFLPRNLWAYEESVLAKTEQKKLDKELLCLRNKLNFIDEMLRDLEEEAEVKMQYV